MTENDVLESPATGLARLTGWQKIVVALSLVLTLAGGGLTAWAALTAPDAPEAPPSESNTSELAVGFAPGETPVPSDDVETDTRPVDDWAPMVFKLGFSFFVGFAIAFALRTFLRISLISAGFFLLLLFGLQYLGVLEVRWDRIGDWFENVGPWLGAQTSSFRAFILGSLPSTASGAAGLVIGFRQRR